MATIEILAEEFQATKLAIKEKRRAFNGPDWEFVEIPDVIEMTNNLEELRVLINDAQAYNNRHR